MIKKLIKSYFNLMKGLISESSRIVIKSSGQNVVINKFHGKVDIRVNGKKVDPNSKEGKKIMKDTTNTFNENMDEANKAFQEAGKAMSEAGEEMAKAFKNIKF